MKRILFYLIGLSLMTLGVTSIIASDLGASAWDSFFVGLSNTIGLTTGMWIIIICSLVMLLNAYLLRERIDFLAVITVTIQGVLIDFWLLVVFSRFVVSSYGHQGVLFLFGFVAVVLGIGTYLQANFAPDPVDNLMIAIHKRFKLSVSRSRLLCEGLALIMALFFSGPVFIGTFIFTFGIGPLIQVSQTHMHRLYERLG